MTTVQFSDLRRWTRKHGVLLTLALVAASTLAFLPFRPLLDSEQWGWPYMLVVGLVASTYGVWLAVLSAVLCFFSWNFLFIQPYYTLHVNETADLVHLLAFLVVALTVGLQTGRLRESSEAASSQASRTAALYRLSSHMVLGISPAEMAEQVDAEVRGVLSADAVFVWVFLNEGAQVLSPLPRSAHPHVTAESYAAAESALAAGDDAGTFTAANSTFFRLSTTSGTEGFLQVHGSTELDADDRIFAESVAHLAAVYLENRHMGEVAMKASAAQEAEKLRTALVSSVSHELKTPVASLTASVTDLIGRSEAPSSVEMRESLAAMATDLSRLDRSIGNLLDASRLEAQAWKPSPTSFEVGELIGSVSNQLGRDLRRRLVFAVPEGIPLVRADFVQVSRALRHLVDNALQYSSGPVTIGADTTHVGLARVWVADTGPGIPEQEQKLVFERFFRGSAGRHSKSSTGLGLSLAREIVMANGGRIHVEDVKPSGVRFVVTLPAVTATPDSDVVSGEREAT